LFAAAPPLFGIGPLTLQVPQVGDVPAQPLTASVRTPLSITVLSCESPVHPVSRSAASPFASNVSELGHPPGPGVGDALTVGVAVRVVVGVAVGVGVLVGPVGALHSAG
jgi:hypothetical protein